MKFASKTIKFLGYFPFEWKGKPLHVQMKYARMVSGYTQSEMAKYINCDSSSISKISRVKSSPSKLNKKKIEGYVQKYII